MGSFVLILAVLCQFTIEECLCLRQVHVNVTQPIQPTLNTTTYITKALPLYNETSLANFTYTLSNHANNSNDSTDSLESSSLPEQVDCFGLGRMVAKGLEWFFKSKPNGTHALDVQFLLSSRKQPQRTQVVLGEQFGLEWTDFQIERRTVIIVHGFLSHGQEMWIKNMENALLGWDDVNVVVVDWSAGGNTWNYYKAAVNTRIVGYQISKFIEHITNTTINKKGPDTSNWGPLYLIGHSLGAHICGFAAKELKKRQNQWTVQRITGLDPAQPCFHKVNSSIHLHKSDAPFIDVIHTNARLFNNLGLGLPEPIAHVDFYPNGGQTQPGCLTVQSTYFRFLPISKAAIQQAICSHGRSYIYFTESLVSAAARNCSFWARRWDLTYRHIFQIIEESCSRDNCIEMGIRAEMYDLRGAFFIITASSRPFCVNNTHVINEMKEQLERDYHGETKD